MCKNRKNFAKTLSSHIAMPLASPLDPPAAPLTVTGSVGSGFPIGSGDSSTLLFEVFFDSVVFLSFWISTRNVIWTQRDKKGYFNKAEEPRNVLFF